MKKFICFFISFFFLSSCIGNLAAVDSVWEKENRELFNKIGVREYTGVTKEQAINAMVIAFQRLDIIIENSDFKIGTLTGTATAPKPINYEEFQTVIAAEDVRAKSIAPGFIWNLRGFDSKFNIIFLEIPNGVQVSMRAKLNYTGRTDFIPIQNFPPKATEIAIRKIWNEFEKIEFIQRATLRKK
jgi:hypothetical protein